MHTGDRTSLLSGVSALGLMADMQRYGAMFAPETMAGAGAAAGAEGGSEGGSEGGAAAPAADAKPEGEAKTEGEAKPEGETKPEGEAKAEGEGKDEKKPEGPPEKYEFKAPEGFEKLDEAALAEFEPMARELGLSQEQAQRLVDQYAKQVAKIGAQQAEALETQVRAWEEASKADKEFGGDKLDASLGDAIKARDAYGNDAFKAMLDETGIGSHPEMIRFLAKVGKEVGEDVVVTGRQDSDAKASLASRIYTTHNK